MLCYFIPYLKHFMLVHLTAETGAGGGANGLVAGAMAARK